MNWWKRVERYRRSLALFKLPIGLPLKLYPCGDLGYLAVPELLINRSVTLYVQGVKMALYR